VTFDASNVVPYDAALVAITGVFDAGSSHTTVKLRRDERGQEYNLCKCSNNAHAAGTCIIPIVRSFEKRTFDYNIESGSSSVNSLKIVGYYKVSRVGGTGFIEAQSSDGASSGNGKSSGFGAGVE
jgi:hypothetical protein